MTADQLPYTSLPSASPQASPPTRIVLADDIAVLEKKLGEGGMSEVWHAYGEKTALTNPRGLLKALVLRGELPPSTLGLHDIPFEEPTDVRMPKRIADSALIERINRAYADERKRNISPGEEENLLEMLGLKGVAHLAVKVFRLPHETSPEDRADLEQRFSLEASVLRKLSHPGIVKTYGIIHDPIGECLLLEYIDGLTLKDYAAKNNQAGQLEFEEAARITLDIASALRYAHANGVIHRDIKPANIIMRTDGRPVITDFGIAKLFDPAKTYKQTLIVGTLPYMAPEQLDGKVTELTDVYQVGCLLYTLLAGRDRYDLVEQTELIKALKSRHHPNFISDLRKKISKRFEAIVDLASEKSIDDRFTLDELIEELEELVATRDYTKQDQQHPTTRLRRELKKVKWEERMLATRLHYREQEERIIDVRKLLQAKQYAKAQAGLAQLTQVFELAERYDALKEAVCSIELDLAKHYFVDTHYPAVGIILEGAEKHLQKLPSTSPVHAAYKEMQDAFSPYKMFVKDFNTKRESVAQDVAAVINEHCTAQTPLEEAKRQELLEKITFVETSLSTIPKEKIGPDYQTFTDDLRKLRGQLAAL